MTDIHPAGADGTSLFAAVVKIVAVVATLAWALAVLSFIAAINGSGVNALAVLLAFVLGTPVFSIFVLPALLFSFLGGQSGAKVGAGFLAAGALVVGIFFAGPTLRVMF